MNCSNCHKLVDEDSKFCQFCGSKVEEVTFKDENSLWKRFVELSFESDARVREKNRTQIPLHIKELIKRFSSNLFDTLKEENVLILDIPFETLEEIRTSYYLLAEDGFWIYCAKNSSDINKIEINLQVKNVDKVVEEWKEKYTKSDKVPDFDQELLDTLMASSNMQLNELLKKHEELKKLPAKIIESIKSDLLRMPLWIYSCCRLSE